MGYRQLSEQERYVIGRLFRQHRSRALYRLFIRVERRRPSAVSSQRTPDMTAPYRTLSKRPMTNMPSPGDAEAGGTNVFFVLEIGVQSLVPCDDCGAPPRSSAGRLQAFR